ncbi:MAG TPA: hypothetical protein VEI52_27770 [Terriglobales bacterium]|nr:hypothetical protein [Terriglobales bacterium]
MKARIVPVVSTALVVLLSTLAPAASDGSQAFEKLKSLDGSWSGKATNGQAVQISNRVTSGGSVFMSEITGHEDMITMFHLDGGRLLMTHYCAAGNQPRMVGTLSPDGKTITFDFLDATNLLPSQGGHMDRVVFTLIDADHHSEDWQFAQDGGQKLHEKFDLVRQK